MVVTSPIPSQDVIKYPYRGIWYWISVWLVILSLNILSYCLYRFVALYLKWRRDEKSILQMFQELVELTILTCLYMLAGNYFAMFDCRPDRIVLEYVIPFLIALFLIGFCCEVSYMRVRLVDIRNWELKTWIVFVFILAVTVTLIVTTFHFCSSKEYYFVYVVPCLVYFAAGFILSLCRLHPRLRFHPRSYQVIFALCLLRKDHNFYSRVFAGICSGAFVRSVAANPLLSLLEPLDTESVRMTASRQTLTDSLIPAEVPVSIPEVSPDIDDGMLNRSTVNEEDENRLLETIEKYNQENQLDRNQQILELDERDDYLYSSRASDYADWNEKQKQELLGDPK